MPTDVTPHVIEAKVGGRTVGLGLLTKGSVRLLRCLPITCWRLMNTGHVEVDDLVIEYNDFLVDRGMAEQVRTAMLTHLVDTCELGRLDITHASPELSQVMLSLPRQQRGHEDSVICHVVDLDAVRGTGEAGYLSLLSANSRSQLRRSMGAYRQVGELRVHAAETVEQGLAYFDELKLLHAATWAERGEHSSFGESAFADRFHRELISTCLEKGETQLLHIQAGDETLGYLYNFVQDGLVMYYQSGLRYGLLPKHDKPGMVCHTLAVQHYAEAGLQEYNLTAGAYRYKASLSTGSEPLHTCHLYRPTSLSSLDAQARQLKRKWVDALRKRLRPSSSLRALTATIAIDSAIALSNFEDTLTWV